MVERASRLGKCKNNPSEDVGNDWDVVWLIVNTGVPEVLLVKADRLKVDPLLTASMTELCVEHVFC